MKGFIAISIIAIIILSSGCIMESNFSISEIQLLDEFIDPSNYTPIKEEVIGDEQTVIFYVEASGFRTKKTSNGYEFWISVDIKIGDEYNNTYLEKINEKEIHLTNSTEKSGTVWYKYSWFTGSMVRSGWYTVRIAVTDQLTDEIKRQEKTFYLDLSRIY